MPVNCNLHLSILNSIRISQYFKLPEGTKVYANVGTDGIDGCMSSFFGQSVATLRESFLIIGDLSFFYDMNSLRIKHNGSNCHIMMINNHGGNEFYLQPLMPTTPQGLGASHINNAKGWVESVGFEYISATSIEEFERNISVFVQPRKDRPIFFEIFTDQMIDRETVHALKNSYYHQFDDLASVKDAMKSVLGKDKVKKLKSFFNK